MFLLFSYFSFFSENTDDEKLKHINKDVGYTRRSELIFLHLFTELFCKGYVTGFRIKQT